jgi:2-C-methyl-D-erythritol 4-phosphate cytidylyltransferase/2-C-methyl-D-erythritol 2,4-cyclodiphosphate synthase
MDRLSGTSAVIPAAGRGERFGSGSNKVFAAASGKPILAHTLSAFERCDLIDEIVLVVGEAEIDEARTVSEEYGISKVKAVVAGGSHRQDSVWRGIEAISGSSDIVAIHDGARPLIHQETIEATIAAAREYGAAVAAAPVIETIKIAGPGDFVISTPDRSLLWGIQTPQTFQKELLVQAFQKAWTDGYYATDDAALVEHLGHPVKLVRGTYDNIKVTTPQDLDFVEARLRIGPERCRVRPGGSKMVSIFEGGNRVQDIRTGFGYDIHRFQEGRALFLGGVEFPGEVGLEGHSDADVILHAIADALLGAAALGDIGRHFPNTDESIKGISSLVLLEKTAAILAGAGWTIVNVDATLVSERPKIAARAAVMQERIGAALGIDAGRVGIKATTAEKLGDIGAGNGAACYAVATVTECGDSNSECGLRNAEWERDG